MILFLLVIVQLSCTKLIDDEFPDYENVPTVNSIIISGDQIMIHISLADKIDTTELIIIDDAMVILKTSQEEVDTLIFIGGGLYASDLIAEEGVRYDIEVKVEGYDKIYGSDSVPEAVKAQITDHTNTFSFNEEGRFMEAVWLEFHDNPNTMDFYEVALIKSIESDSYYVFPFNNNSHLILNEGFEPYSTPSILFKDQLMEDSIGRFYLDFNQNFAVTNYGDSLVQNFYEHYMILEFRHVSEAYYNFKKSFYFYTKDRYPGFIEGTASYFHNYSNVENGIGIIGAYSFTRDSIWIPEEHLKL